MAMVTESATLLGIRQLDFADKKTGEIIKGTQLYLARPARDPKFEGWGMFVFKLSQMGDEGFAMAPSFVRQANGLFMRSVNIDCELVTSGKTRLLPLSISASSSSSPSLSAVA